MPEVKDAYESQEDAEKAAAKMLEYNHRFEAKRGKQKRRRRCEETGDFPKLFALSPQLCGDVNLSPLFTE